MESGTAETATILPRLPQSVAVQLFAGAIPHHLKAGEALFMVGGAGDGCYRLEQGLLKVVITPRAATTAYSRSLVRVRSRASLL
jgi:CRP/FNR family transcriptional regulator, cyclic AMP receptor protein